MSKLKYAQGDIVLIYKNTPTFADGGVCQVIDRDPMDKSYAVADLRNVGKEDGDILKLLKYHVKWVKEDQLIELNFNKPLTFLEKIKSFFRRLFRRS